MIPGAYGRVSIPAKIPLVAVSGSDLLLLCVWCEGEVDAVEGVYINDEALPAAQCHHYTGEEEQGVDPWLAAAIEGYTDTLPGVSYSVIRLKPDDSLSRTIEARVRGWHVYDPRPMITDYRRNPALALADFIVRTTGRAMDWDSVEALADIHDDIMADGQPRRRIDLLIDTVAAIDTWIETLREYAGCFIVWDDPVRLVPDRPRAVDHSIGPASILTLELRKAGMDDSPNRVVVEYLDTTQEPWRTREAATPYPVGEQLREQRVTLLGIQHYAQALRQAEDRLARYNLIDLRARLTVFDEGLEVTEGDIVAVSHPVGLADKEFRVLAVDAIDRGRWAFELEEYAPGAYSDDVTASPTTPDTGLPDPTVVPDGPAPVLTEEVYQLQNGTYSTRLRITWATVNYPYYHQYMVAVSDGAEDIWKALITGNEYVTGALQEGVEYTVTIGVLGFGGIASTTNGSATITAQGKLLPPGDVPSLSAFEVGGEVRLAWEAAIDLDIWRYELRYAEVGDTWAQAQVIDRIDGLRTSTRDVPPGTWDLLIRAIDSVGNYSPNDTRITITVTLDSDARFQGEQYLDNAEAVAMQRLVSGTWVPRIDGDTWYNVFTGDWGDYPLPVAAYHSGGTQEWISETIDVGTVVSGVWQLQHWGSSLRGVITRQIELSEDGITWALFPGQSSVYGKARYGRARLRAAGLNSLMVEVPYVYFRVDAFPRTETGSLTTSAAGATTVVLEHDYVSFIAINLQPSGTTPRTAVFDNVQMGSPSSFDVYLFDASGDQVAGDVSWEFKGV